MVDLSVLEAKINAIAALIENIKADYAAMLSLINELEEVVKGKNELQTKVDNLAAKLSVSLSELEAVDNSFPVAFHEEDPEVPVDPEPEPDPEA
jgi:predicted  nucleic acid-binding Zn-ribbon protein